MTYYESIRKIKSNCSKYEIFRSGTTGTTTNAIGRKLLGLQILSLDLSQSDQKELVHLLDKKTKEECNAIIDNAVKFVCQDVGMEDKQIVNYFEPLAKGLSIRMYSAVKCRNFANIFISLLPEEIVP